MILMGVPDNGSTSIWPMTYSARSSDGRETMAEDPLSEAQVHVTEGERRVAEQIDLIARMKAAGDSEQTIAALEAALVRLRQILELAREYLELEQQRQTEAPPD